MKYLNINESLPIIAFSILLILFLSAIFFIGSSILFTSIKTVLKKGPIYSFKSKGIPRLIIYFYSVLCVIVSVVIVFTMINNIM